ncbi:MAG TPA: mechanosensitive ion channel family protein [Nitrospirae bacterium]|nr:mechanosensitive ion channel family protein [Nitrospirota bacterium]
MPSVFWCIAIGLYIGLVIAELPKKQFEVIYKVLIILITFSISLAIANLVSKLFKHYFDKLELPIPTTGLFYVILKGTIIIIGFIIIMATLGISIAPVLTALGVGGLAVALALKDTLENLFSGIHILVEKTIRVGDFVRLENGNEGYVEDITWRTTRIKTLQNNMVIIPNSKLSQSIVLNFSLPTDNLSVQIPISVSYNEDPDRIEKILLEEANIMKENNDFMIKDIDPQVRFNPGFSDSSIDFTVICHINNIKFQFQAIHEFRKRIFKRFKDEGIEIPFPQRVVYLKKIETTT